MSTSTATFTESSSSQHLSSSISSLSSQQATDPRLIARIYKQAADLFVTRRVEEALELITPLLEVPSTPAADQDADTRDTSSEPQVAPIANASRGARIKVWTLYISILNAIVEMGPEDGRSAFGNARWKELAAKVKEGKVWQEIIDIGYGGVENDVDADIVANLATLLLAHAPSQRLTQQRLESYLSASSRPSLDVEGHMQRRKLPHQSHSNGTSTPRDLNQRLKILEIYTLHVLPRNHEWEYAREFIGMSEVLDEERREAFLQALQQIQEEREFDSKREEQLQRERDQQLEAARKRDEEVRKAQQAKAEQEEKATRRKPAERGAANEDDYGVDRSNIGSQSKSSSKPTSSGQSAKPVNSRSKPSSSQPNRKPSNRPVQKTPATVTGRMGALLSGVQTAVVAMGRNFRSHPMMLLRIFAFFIALLMALSRNDVRERLTRIRDSSWNKIKQTIGMGVKVSYV